MKRLLPLLLAPVFTACGNDALLLEYIIDVEVQANDGLGSQNVALLQIGKCANADVFDETLLVYDDFVPDPVLAVKVNWIGFDLSEGGDNYHIYLAAEGDNVQIRAALLPELVLYEVDRKGRITPVADEVDKTSKDEFTANYQLGLGLPIVEIHTLDEQINEVAFIEQSAGNCDANSI